MTFSVAFALNAAPDLLRYNRISMRVETQDQPAGTGISPPPRHEFQALISGAGVYRLDRAHIALTGSDRVRWLNGMITNNVRDLAPGHGVYAFLLNPQGKIQADLYAFNRGDDLIIETQSRQAARIIEIFDRYIIMDDVEVQHLAGKFAVISIAGPASLQILRAIGFVHELKTLEFSVHSWDRADLTIVCGDNPIVPNFEIWALADHADEILKVLLEAGGQAVSDETLETFRVACGIPKFGQDIRERDLPQETGQDRALNFNKGCYIGQEIVERVRSRGALHRALAGFELAGVLSPGTRLQYEGKDVGELTSVAVVPAGMRERVLALGYLRKEFMPGDKSLAAGGVEVRVAKLPFEKLFS
jgi:aminomethyltransferase